MKKELEKIVKSIDLMYEGEKEVINIDINNVTYLNLGEITETREVNSKDGMLLHSNCNNFVISIDDFNIDEETKYKLSNYRDLIYITFHFESGFEEAMYIPYKPYKIEKDGNEIIINIFQDIFYDENTGINICVAKENI